MNDTILEPCDIILSAGSGFLSSQIRWWTRSWLESRTFISHVSMVVEGGTIEEAIVHDALAPHWRGKVKDIYITSGTRFAVARPININDFGKSKIIEYAEQEAAYLKTRKWDYNYAALIAHLGDSLLGDIYLFRRLLKSMTPICSLSVARCYSSAGMNFYMRPGKASPDDIWDFVIENEGKAFRIIKGLMD